MKKILILMMTVIMAVTAAACGAGDVGGPEVSSKTESQAPVSSAVSSDDVEDNFAGLLKYLSANKAISGNGVKMRADYIGAKSGLKYQYGFNGNNNVTVELYEFDLDNLDAKAKSVISEIKEKNSFTILNNNFPAVLSDNGKYMMIYRDTSSTKPENKQQQEEVTKLFKEFKK